MGFVLVGFSAGDAAGACGNDNGNHGHVRRVLIKFPEWSDLVPAAEHGYWGWECPRCGDALGDCAGPNVVRALRRCGCGGLVTEVVR